MPVDRVIVSTHAVDRFHERFPELCGGRSIPSPSSRGQILRRLHREVNEALAEGRWSARKPGWATPARRDGRRLRFCWPEDRAYCFALIRRKHETTGEECWIVCTVMAPASEETLWALNRMKVNTGHHRDYNAHRSGGSKAKRR